MERDFQDAQWQSWKQLMSHTTCDQLQTQYWRNSARPAIWRSIFNRFVEGKAFKWPFIREADVTLILTEGGRQIIEEDMIYNAGLRWRGIRISRSISCILTKKSRTKLFLPTKKQMLSVNGYHTEEKRITTVQDACKRGRWGLFQWIRRRCGRIRHKKREVQVYGLRIGHFLFCLQEKIYSALQDMVNAYVHKTYQGPLPEPAWLAFVEPPMIIILSSEWDEYIDTHLDGEEEEEVLVIDLLVQNQFF